MLKHHARKLLVGAALILTLLGASMLGHGLATAHAPVHPHEIACTIPLPPCI